MNSKNPILLVDDEEALTYILKKMLEEFGYKVFVASSAEKALDLVSAVRFSAVISDISLPNMSGIEFIQSIKSGRHRFPILVLTGLEDRETPLICLKAGADEVLFKPCSIEHLDSTLKKCIQNHEIAAVNLSRRIAMDFLSTICVPKGRLFAVDDELFTNLLRLDEYFDQGSILLFFSKYGDPDFFEIYGNSQNKRLSFVIPKSTLLGTCEQPMKVLNYGTEAPLSKLLDLEIKQGVYNIVPYQNDNYGGLFLWTTGSADVIDGIDLVLFENISTIINPIIGNLLMAKNLEVLNQALLENYEGEKAKSKSFANLALIGQSTASVAHDLSDPLTVANYYLEQIGAREIFSHPKDFEKVTLCLSKISSIVMGLKNVCSSSGPGAQKFEEFSIASVIDESLIFIENHLLKYKVVPKIDCADQIYIKGVKVQLCQVFSNLIKNAIEACMNNEKIEIQIVTRKIKNDRCLVEIIDNGVGIELERAMDIFEIFKSSKGTGYDRGLGLHICQTFVNGHGGRIYCVPGELGGAIFKVELPIFDRL